MANGAKSAEHATGVTSTARSSKPVFITRRAFDRLIDRWREAYSVLGHLGAAKEMGSVLWARDVEVRNDSIDLRPVDRVTQYVAKRRRPVTSA